MSVILGTNRFLHEIVNCNLCKNGYCVAKHIRGRKNKHKCMDIPKNIDLILVLTDYVNHAVSNRVKKESKRLGIKTIYSKRAWGCVVSSLRSYRKHQDLRVLRRNQAWKISIK